MSTPTRYLRSSLNTPDEDMFKGRMAPGTNCDDAPVTQGGKNGWFLNAIGDGRWGNALASSYPVEAVATDEPDETEFLVPAL